MKLSSALLASFCSVAAAQADTLHDTFPYPLIEVTGAEALQEWQALRPQAGTPIILRDREQVERILDVFHPSQQPFYQPIEQAIAKAKTQPGLDPLYAHLRDEHQLLIESVRDYDADWAAELAGENPLEVPADYWGPWPEGMQSADRLISLDDWQTGRPKDKVFITILPTEAAWQAPIYLRFGGWNANPPPYVHAAAFRHWGETYGAVPVVIQSDTVEMLVADPASDRDAARELATQQYLYASDIVDQGVGDLSALAALLHKGGFWNFWWD